MTRPPRDMTRKREISVQLNMSIKREIKQMIRAEAEARGMSIPALIEALVKQHCKRGE